MLADSTEDQGNGESNMINLVLLYAGAALPLIWGVAHLFPTKNVVAGFGDISLDNKRIITMEWINEAAALFSSRRSCLP